MASGRDRRFSNAWNSVNDTSLEQRKWTCNKETKLIIILLAKLSFSLNSMVVLIGERVGCNCCKGVHSP